MPSRVHEVLLGMFKNRPVLAGQVLTGPLGVEVPAYRDARLESSELTAWKPAEYRADAVISLTGEGGPDDRLLAVVVEIQRARDNRKRWSWPVYMASIRARMECEVALLVVCPNARVAAWCAQPILLGPGSVVRPLVLGPASVPPIIDTETAVAVPELTVFSALMHGGGPSGEQVLKATMEALNTLDAEMGRTCGDLLHSQLPKMARKYLEALMQTETYQGLNGPFSQLAQQWEAKGEAKGKAEEGVLMVLDVLAVRGLELSPEQHATITACTDETQLRAWLRRAIQATTADELFT